MKLTELLCCCGAFKKAGLTQDEINGLNDPNQRNKEFMQELCKKLKQNSVKTQEFFSNRYDRDFFRYSQDLSCFMYAEVLASPENRNYALQLAKAYQKDDPDAREIIDSLGEQAKTITHPGFQERIQGKDIVSEVNERSGLLSNH